MGIAKSVKYLIVFRAWKEMKIFAWNVKMVNYYKKESVFVFLHTKNQIKKECVKTAWSVVVRCACKVKNLSANRVRTIYF